MKGTPLTFLFQFFSRCDVADPDVCRRPARDQGCGQRVRAPVHDQHTGTPQLSHQIPDPAASLAAGTLRKLPGAHTLLLSTTKTQRKHRITLVNGNLTHPPPPGKEKGYEVDKTSSANREGGCRTRPYFSDNELKVQKDF